MSIPPQIWTFYHCVRKTTFFYLDCDRTSTFTPKWNVDISSHVTGAHLEVFWLVLQGWAKSRLENGPHWHMDQLGVCPSLTWPTIWWGSPSRTQSEMWTFCHMSLDHSWFFLAFLARDGKNVTIVTFHTPPTHGLVGRLALSNLTLNMVSHKQQNSTNPGLVGCLA